MGATTPGSQNYPFPMPPSPLIFQINFGYFKKKKMSVFRRCASLSTLCEVGDGLKEPGPPHDCPHLHVRLPVPRPGWLCLSQSHKGEESGRAVPTPLYGDLEASDHAS